MEITLNGTALKVAPGTSLAQLLQEHHGAPHNYYKNITAR